MKYLEHVGLEAISSTLSKKEIGGGLALNGRVEIYSTKKTGEDKKQSKIIEQNLLRQRSNSVSCAEKTTRKLLVDLIQTLLLTHSDYDCSDMSADAFDSLTAPEAVQHISSALAEVTVREPDFLVNLWREVDEAMDKQLRSTEAYIVRDTSCLEDPDEEVMWSLHVFFCHKELRRICYFACSARTKYRATLHSSAMMMLNNGDDSEAEEEERMEEDMMSVDEENSDAIDSDDDELNFWRS